MDPLLLGTRVLLTQNPSMAKIVVVDDNKLLRHMLRDILKSYGHQVVEAEDGEEALVVITKELPTVVITDFYMPKMTGADLVKALHDLDATTSIPVIGLAGSYDAERQLKEANVFAFLPKPLHKDLFMTTVESAIAFSSQSRTSP